jgi:hypothetical protein
MNMLEEILKIILSQQSDYVPSNKNASIEQARYSQGFDQCWREVLPLLSALICQRDMLIELNNCDHALFKQNRNRDLLQTIIKGGPHGSKSKVFEN